MKGTIWISYYTLVMKIDFKKCLGKKYEIYFYAHKQHET